MDLMRMLRFLNVMTISRFAVIVALCCAPGFAGTLSWYTGDPENTTAVGLTNEISTLFGNVNVYDAFIVPAGGWQVTSVFSNDELFPGSVITDANWQIRSGLSNGNGGTLVASGTSPASLTQVFAGSNYFIDTVQVNNLSADLSPWEYWLSVAPVNTGDASNCCYGIIPTNDANAVGLPVEHGTGTLTFDNYPSIGLNYVEDPTSAGSPHDWSMGLFTSPLTATPEPSTLSLLGIGLLFPCIRRLRRAR
jgi:hypothetical protein